MKIIEIIKSLKNSRVEENNNSTNNEEQNSELLTEKDRDFLSLINKTKFTIFKVFVSLGVLILLFLILILHYPSHIEKVDQWEYKVIRFYNLGEDREGAEAFKQTEIMVSENRLNELGAEGWELVSSSLEIETAYPNFGNSSYVTGLQPNVRSQAIVSILKRKIIRENKE